MTMTSQDFAWIWPVPVDAYDRTEELTSAEREFLRDELPARIKDGRSECLSLPVLERLIRPLEDAFRHIEFRGNKKEALLRYLSEEMGRRSKSFWGWKGQDWIETVEQFGINGDPKVSALWKEARIKDDPVKISNKRTFVTFATAGHNTRTTLVFISFGDNHNLDSQGFAPFGQVVSGMKVVDSLYNGYGEGAPQGLGPEQGKLQTQGNKYLAERFGLLDYIKKATIEQ